MSIKLVMVKNVGDIMDLQSGNHFHFMSRLGKILKLLMGLSKTRMVFHVIVGCVRV